MLFVRIYTIGGLLILISGALVGCGLEAAETEEQGYTFIV